jgi:hypothetical protein
MNTKSQNVFRLSWACLLALFLAFNLRAQTVTQTTNLTINCCFDEANQYGPQRGALVIGSPGDLWNATWGAASLAAGEVIDTAGNIVPNVGISVSGGTYFASTSGTAYDFPTLGLMEAYYTKQNGMLTNSITGLTPYIGCSFTLVIYGAGNGASQGDNLNIIAGATGGSSGSTVTTSAASRRVSAGLGVCYNFFTGTISGGTLTFTATNSGFAGGNGYSALNGIQLQITGAPGASPVISTQPQSISVFTNNTAVFNVPTVSSNAVSFQWAAAATGSGGPYTNLSNGGQVSGAASPILTVANLTPANALDYVVIATNVFGSVTSSPATLTVNPGNQNQLIDVQVGGGNVQSGAAVLGQSGDTWNGLTYVGGPPFNNTTIKDSSGTVLSGVEVISDNWSGKVSNSTGGSTTAEDAATTALMESYIYTATTSAPSNAIVEVIYGLAPYVGENFQLVIYAAGNGANQGSALNILTGASGGNTVGTLTTSGKTRQISQGIGWAYNIFSGVLTNGTLMFSSTNSGATIYGAVNGFQLELFATNPPPVILQQPVSAAIAVDSSFTNTVIAYGTGTLYYQWYTNVVIGDVTNGVPIGSAANITGATASGVYTNSLIINPALPMNSGSYYVVITNLNGAVTSAVVNLTVAAAPDIINQLPITYSNVLNTNYLTLYAGANPAFSVSAIGASPLSYHWFTNGVAIGGATNVSVTLTNVTTNVLGGFTTYCVVTNLVGSSTSVVWSASVIPDPTNSSSGLAPYPSNVLALNPIGYWRLNDTNLDDPDNGGGDNGYICHDYAGGNDGVYSNIVLGETGYNPATDPSDNSALFGDDPDGNNTDSGDQEANYIEGINFGTPAGTSAAFTVEAWVMGYPQTVGGGLVSLGWGNGGEQFNLDCGAATNAFRFFMRDAAGNTHDVSSTVLPSTTAGLGPWYHLAAVVDEIHSQTVTFYINGSPIGSAIVTNGSGVLASTYPMVIGARSSAINTNNNLQFEGYINDVSVFNYALSSNQIANEYLSSGIAPFFTQQPVSATNVDLNGTLAVPEVAIGTPPLSYEWFDVNANNYLAGQTNATLVISNIQASDSYYVTVTGPDGSTNSSQVAVSVISGLSLTVQGPLALYAGQTASYSATSQGNYPIYYQWFTNSVAVGNATNPTFTLVMPAGSSTVGCTVTNSYNGYSSSNITLNLTGIPVSTLYQLTVLSNNPVAYWRLNEAEQGNGDNGVVAYDYAGGHNGAYNNTVLGFPGFDPAASPDTAALFGVYAAANTYMGETDESANGVSNINFGGPAVPNAEFSVECWVDVTNNIGGAFVTKGWGGGAEQFCLDSGTTSHQFRFFVRNAAATAMDANSAIAPVAGNWYHLVGVCDEANGVVTLYVDGVSAGTVAITPGSGLMDLTNDTSLAAANLVSVGSRTSSQTATSMTLQNGGLINEVALYNYPLSAAQVATHYAAGSFGLISTNPTNIVASVTNNQLYLSWPANHIGWQLQAQTNSVSKGISTNWANYNPSTTIHQVAIPINLTNGTVFYRLIYMP